MDLPLSAAMSDVEVRIKKGNDMLLSGILALRELLSRFDAEEADDEGHIWTWPEFRDQRFCKAAARGEKPCSISWANKKRAIALSPDPEAALNGRRFAQLLTRADVGVKDGGFKALLKAWEKANKSAQADFLTRIGVPTPALYLGRQS